MAELYIGLMSGTSLDGVDAVLVDLSRPAPPIAVRRHEYQSFSPALRQALFALNSTGPDELHRAALASNALSRVYGDLVRDLLKNTGCAPSAIRAIGAHGQTVRHRPGEFDGTGYTVQLINGALLAEHCEIDVVCDFRSRDLAAGGQGAPLVPAFHAAVFQRPGLSQAVLNLGGIANLTLLGPTGQVQGFDCGPGNALLDLWCERHLGHAFDDNGQWAASGQAVPQLLAAMLHDPYFNRMPPKSTGRDLFNASWLETLFAGPHNHAPVAPADVQNTLAELTVASAASALKRHLPGAETLLVCGGGALNGHLMQRLTAWLPGVSVMSSGAAGLPPMQVEATAFAWLAKAFIDRAPANCPAVTGASGPRVLGALYPAR